MKEIDSKQKEFIKWLLEHNHNGSSTLYDTVPNGVANLFRWIYKNDCYTKKDAEIINDWLYNKQNTKTRSIIKLKWKIRNRDLPNY